MEYIKLTKAEMLPNFVLRLVFNENQVRYFYLREKGTTKTIEFWLLGVTTGWMGHELVIDESGETLTINGKTSYSAHDLYEQSLEHLKF